MPPEVTFEPPNDAERRYVEALLAALKAGDFAAFERDSLPPPYLDTPGLPDREAHARREARERREMFDRFAGRVDGVRRWDVMSSSGRRHVTAILRATDPTDRDVQLRCEVAGTTGARPLAPSLTYASTERPVEAIDREHIDRIVAALVAVDWAAYDGLTPGPSAPREHKRDYFDLFARKVGGLRSVTGRVDFLGHQTFDLVLDGRDPGAPHLTLSLTAWPRDGRKVFTASWLLEHGFDYMPIENTRNERTRQRLAEEEAQEKIDQAARVRAATRAVRLQKSASDEEILGVLKRWNDTIAAGDYETALEMVAYRDGWARGEELRDFIADLDIGDNRPGPHRVTPFATAGELRPPLKPGEMSRGFLWPDISVSRHGDEVHASFTPPLDGYWAPFFVQFEAVDVDGMWVLDADVSGFASMFAALGGKQRPRNARAI